MSTAPLEISRKTWAAVEQMAVGAIQAGAAPGGSGRGGAEGVILIRNDTGAKLEYRGIVGLQDIVTKPPAAGWEFSLQYIAVKPDPARYAFAIAMEEISAGAAGFALAFGIHSAKVEMKDGGHQYAEPVKDQTARLASCDSGPARILFKSGSNGTVDALVLFPVGGGGGTGEALDIVYIRSTPTAGTATVSDVYLRPDPESDPNWGALLWGSTARRRRGDSPYSEEESDE